MWPTWVQCSVPPAPIYQMDPGTMLGQTQAQNISTAFTSETITWQATWQWDPINNCILFANSQLIGHLLDNFPLYNLTTMTQPPTTITSNVQMAMTVMYTTAATKQHNSTTAHNVTNSDSLSNLLNTFSGNVVHHHHYTSGCPSIPTEQTWTANLQSALHDFGAAGNHLDLDGGTATLARSVQQLQWYDWDCPFSPEQTNMNKETHDHDINTHAHQCACGIPTWKMPAYTNEGSYRGKWVQCHRITFKHPIPMRCLPTPNHTMMTPPTSTENTIAGVHTKQSWHILYQLGDKWTQTVHLVLQNFGRWPQWNSHQKNQIIWQFLNDNNIDVFLTTKNNVVWNQIAPAQCL